MPALVILVVARQSAGVVSHDPASGSFVVASEVDPTAAWYQNVLHTPEVSIQVGGKPIPVTAVALIQEEGAEIFAEYAKRHRTLAKRLLPASWAFRSTDPRPTSGRSVDGCRSSASPGRGVGG